MSLRISRSSVTRIEVESHSADGTLTADHVVAFAEQLREAIAAGMPGATPVQVESRPQGGLTLRAVADVTEALE